MDSPEKGHWTWWRHQMETFSALLAICAENSPVPVNSPHKGQWRGDLMFTLICARINGWVNNREAGDLRRYRAHYDVIVMNFMILTIVKITEILDDSSSFERMFDVSCPSLSVIYLIEAHCQWTRPAFVRMMALRRQVITWTSDSL